MASENDARAAVLTVRAINLDELGRHEEAKELRERAADLTTAAQQTSEASPKSPVRSSETKNPDRRRERAKKVLVTLPRFVRGPAMRYGRHSEANQKRPALADESLRLAEAKLSRALLELEAARIEPQEMPSTIEPLEGLTTPELRQSGIYIVHNVEDEGGWGVVRAIDVPTSAHADTQTEAIRRAKEIVNNSGNGKGEIRIQGRNGQFRDGISGRHNETSAPDKRP